MSISVALVASHLEKTLYDLLSWNKSQSFFFLLCACGCIFFQDIMNFDESSWLLTFY